MDCMSSGSGLKVRASGVMLVTAGLVLAVGTATAIAQPGTPTFSNAWTDCRTNDNKFVGSDGDFYWDVDANCDIYQQDRYERPMTQTFTFTNGRFGAVEYLEYLDIHRVRAGFDNTYLYVQLEMAGRNQLKSDGTVIAVGMAERYGFRMSTDADGRFGVLLVSDQPEFKNEPNTTWGPLGMLGFRDTDGDVGGAATSGPTGLNVTKTDNANEEDGMNGYDTQIIADGRLDNNTAVLWVRLSPGNNKFVQFALRYGELGFSQADLRNLNYFHFEAIKGGPKDPQNYLWNDKYTEEEAGSPNYGSGGESEFGTQGLENIYEVDTAVGGPIRTDTDPCRADFNGDGALNFFDVQLFLAAFGAGQPLADWNDDGIFDFFDVNAYLAAFSAGCP